MTTNKETAAPKLGPVQLEILRGIRRHGGWSPGGRSGWLWNTEANTWRICESLVRRGFVSVDKAGIYHTTAEGRAALEAHNV